MGPACGFNTYLGFSVVLQSRPGIGEIMNLPKAALLCSTFTDVLHYNNLLLTKDFPTGAYAVRSPFLHLFFNLWYSSFVRVNIRVEIFFCFYKLN